MTTNTTTTTEAPAPLTHSDWCTAGRVELTQHDYGVTTHHCVDCGAHAALTATGTVLPTPTVTGAMAGAGRDDMHVTMEPHDGVNR